MASIGANIKARRRELGLNQEEVARSLGLTQANISRIESSTKGPSSEMLVALAEVLECDVHELLGLETRSRSGGGELGHEAKAFVLRTLENDPQLEIYLRRFVRNSEKMTDEDWKFISTSLKLALGFAEETLKAKRLGEDF
ncbi:MAG: helix-turn-helix transcriptional regulator [Fretibacterium sp.]|nr:helix-turn-helix transcriptional regulator [Fretibacterium sp.]